MRIWRFSEVCFFVPLSSQIRIRDPNQGGRDITEEIMAGGSGSRNSTPPIGRPSSTPTPPQVWLSDTLTYPSSTVVTVEVVQHEAQLIRLKF